MKKLIAFILAGILMLGFTGCKTEEPDIEESESSGVQSESSEPEIDYTGIRTDDGYYFTEMALPGYGGEHLQGAFKWNGDGSFTFQNKNVLHTVSDENELIKSVTLPADAFFPTEDGECSKLSFSGERILVMGSEAQTGCAYFTDDGKMYLANMKLFDKNGNLIKEYPESDVYKYDETGNYIITLPAPEGKTVKNYYGPYTNSVSWISESVAVFNCHLWMGVYDFAADEGYMFHDMTEFQEKHGKFSVYYGADNYQFGMHDGKYYYAAHLNEETSNGAGSLWVFDGKEHKNLLDGVQYNRFSFHENFMLLTNWKDVDGNTAETEVYFMRYDEKEPTLIKTFDGHIDFALGSGNIVGICKPGYFHENSTTVLYSYNVETGEEFEIELGHGTQIELLSAFEVDGKPRFIYTLWEDQVHIYYSHDYGFEPIVLDIEDARGYGIYGNNVSPNGEVILQYKKVDEVTAFKAVKLR